MNYRLRYISLLLLLLFLVSCATPNGRDSSKDPNESPSKDSIQSQSVTSQDKIKSETPDKKPTPARPKVSYKKIMSKEDFLYKSQNGFDAGDIPPFEKYKMTPETEIPQDIIAPLKVPPIKR